MPSASERQGQDWRVIEGAARYFRRNAARTMAGSIVRGLVELITNSRDSGYRLLAASALTLDELQRRGIDVEYVVSSAGKRLIVRDHFEGMTESVMREKLLRYGVTASGFESDDFVRGINARGAKDVGVLGHLKFESIRDGVYAECEIYSGRVRGPTSRAGTESDRARMGIGPGNGTIATLIPDEGVSVPSFDALVRDLDHHIEIRYRPEGQPQIPIRLREVRDRRTGSERDVVGFAPVGELVVDEQITLAEWTHYGAASGRIRVFRSPEPLAPLGSRVTMTRLWKSEAGIMVTDGRTAHDITYFYARGSDDVAARYLFGELYLPQITGLLKEYEQIEARRDAGEEATFADLNPYQVTDPDRLGLNREHPFVLAVEERVRPIIEGLLKELQEELAPSAQERVGQELRDALDRLGEKLAEKLEVGGTDDQRGQQVRWGLSVLPSGLRLELGNERRRTKRVTVYYRIEPAVAPESVAGQVSTESSAIQVSAELISLTPAEGQPGVFRGAFDVTAQSLTDLATVVITVEDKSAVVKVSVRDPVVGPIELDRDLQFSQRQYSSLPGRRKKIELLADPTLADRDVVVSLATDAVALSDATVRLEYDNERGVAVGIFYAESATPASDRIIARCGDLADEAAVVFQDFAARPKIDFKFTDVPSFNGRRFRWDPQDNNRVLIAGSHPTVARVLGPKHAREDGESWPGQSLPQTRAILAELIADAFVFRKLQDAAPTLGIETGNLVDPADYDYLRYEFFEEVVLLCHEALTPEYAG